MDRVARRLLLDVVDAVFAVNGGLLRAGDELGHAVGISAAQWQVLGLVEHGPDTAASVARRRGLRRQSVQETVDRLLARGLVERHPNPADRRAPLIAITDTGTKRLQEISLARNHWLDLLGQDLDPADLAVAARALQLLRERLGVPARDTEHND